MDLHNNCSTRKGTFSFLIGDNPLMVGVKFPNPADNYEMTESAVLVMLRELQRQKERAEKKRLLYVALTRARDHLFMSGSAPSDTGLSLDLARSRIEWVFTSLSVTGDAISAGGLVLPSGLRLSIVSDPLAIPAETGRVSPSLLVVPDECSGKSGTWSGTRYSPGPERVRIGGWECRCPGGGVSDGGRCCIPSRTVSKLSPVRRSPAVRVPLDHYPCRRVNRMSRRKPEPRAWLSCIFYSIPANRIQSEES